MFCDFDAIRSPLGDYNALIQLTSVVWSMQFTPLSGTVTFRDRCSTIKLHPDAIRSPFGDSHRKQKLLTVKKDSEEFFYSINLYFLCIELENT